MKRVPPCSVSNRIRINEDEAEKRACPIEYGHNWWQYSIGHGHQGRHHQQMLPLAGERFVGFEGGYIKLLLIECCGARSPTDAACDLAYREELEMTIGRSISIGKLTLLTFFRRGEY